MENFNDKTSRLEPGYFFFDGLASFFVKPAEKLLHRFVLGINIKSVLSEFPRYTWHVRRFPGENIPILTDELNERAFLFWIQVGTDTELFG